MKTFSSRAALVLAAALALGACGKHSDESNVTTTNETVVTDETTNATALDANLTAPDTLGNAPDGVDNGAAAGNAL